MNLSERAGDRVPAAGAFGRKGHGGDADLKREIGVLARTLDPARLFIWSTVDREDMAEEIVRHGRRAFRKGRSP